MPLRYWWWRPAPGAVLILLYRRSVSVARVPAAAALAAVITGWGVGQYPWMLVDKVTIADAARAGAALAGLLVVVGLAGRHRAARARISAVAHPHQGMDTRLNRFKDGASDALMAAGLTTCSRAARQVA
jgi:hypothetical protein